MSEALLAKDVDWSRKSPCADCPFLKTTPYHEGVAANLPAYGQSIQDQRFAHTCHKTDTRPSCDGPVAGQETGRKVQVCAGSVLMLLKTGGGLDLQLPLLQAAERGEIDLKGMTARALADARVFTLGGLLKFYDLELKKRLRSPKARAARRRAQRRRKREG